MWKGKMESVQTNKDHLHLQNHIVYITKFKRWLKKIFLEKSTLYKDHLFTKTSLQ